MGWILATAVCFFKVSAAFADVSQDVIRVFELSEKLRPGMTISALNELLGPPAEKSSLKGKAAGVIRYQWLHGNMGVGAYEVDDRAYRVDITLPCGNAANATRALGALTRQGTSKYGSTPLFDRPNNQYYWVRDGVRFAFSKYDATTVQSSCSLAR